MEARSFTEAWGPERDPEGLSCQHGSKAQSQTRPRPPLHPSMSPGVRASLPKAQVVGCSQGNFHFTWRGPWSPLPWEHLAQVPSWTPVRPSPPLLPPSPHPLKASLGGLIPPSSADPPCDPETGPTSALKWVSSGTGAAQSPDCSAPTVSHPSSTSMPFPTLITPLITVGVMGKGFERLIHTKMSVVATAHDTAPPRRMWFLKRRAQVGQCLTQYWNFRGKAFQCSTHSL